MKKVLLPLLLLVGVTSCKFSPEDLARDYCKCRADIEAGKKKAEDCKELAESHFLRLQDTENGLKIYTEHVLDCISSSEIRTK